MPTRLKVVNVMASSLNGRIASYPQESDQCRMDQGFIIPEDQQLLNESIRSADAIVTGANSLRVTDKVAEIQNQKGVYPIWAILTQRGLEPDLGFWQQHLIPRWVCSSTDQAFPVVEMDSNVQPIEQVVMPKTSPASFLLNKFQQRGCETIVLFGGGHINRMFYQENLVDELWLTLCPFLYGSKEAPFLVNPGDFDFIKFSLISSQPVASHVFLKYRVCK